MFHSNLVFLYIIFALVVQASLRQRYFTHSSSDSKDSINSTSTQELFFGQRLDHFDRSNVIVFPQRYFINDDYWNRSSGKRNAVFLCVGGEGPALDKSVLSESVHCSDMVQLGKSIGALMIALEHRYYGVSIPTPDFSTKNLRWLNSEQALADIANFHAFITKSYYLPLDIKWITWGGSYPGMLAALARYKYPHLIYAAISSSASLQVSVEMTEYNAIVAESLSNARIGGSNACLTVITDAHKAIGAISRSYAGRRFLEKTFNLCLEDNETPLEDPRNLELFAGDGVVALNVQENDPACTDDYCNVEKICAVLLNDLTGTPFQRIAQFAKRQQPQSVINLPYLRKIYHGIPLKSHQSCRDVSYRNLIQQLNNVSNADRTWLYQTCTQWGFFQTCNNDSTCPFVRGLHDLAVDLDLCETIFNVSASEVFEQIETTLISYGGRHMKCSRTLFVNGEIDPWRGLSVVSAPSGDCPVINVKAASHHYWTHAPKDTDDQYIRQARGKIWKQAMLWLSE